MIIDFHSHDFPDAIAARAMRGMSRMVEGRLWSCGDGTMDNHLDHMALAGVDMAVTCPIATRPDMFDGLLRRAVGIASGEFGERARRMLVPFASVHPRDPAAERHLEAVAGAGIKGVKLHCYYQDFALDDPSVRHVFAKACDLGLVVLCHCGTDLGWEELAPCGAREIETLLKDVRGLKFVAAHLGGCDGYPPHETDRLLETGCCIDTSVLHRRWHYDEPMRLLRSWPRDRILFGTDSPWEHYPEAIRWVKSFRVSEDWNAVLGENACRLLSISNVPAATA